MRRAAALLVLLASALGSVACGGETPARDPVARAAERSADARTYHFDLVIETDVGRATGHGAGDASSSDTTIDFGREFSVKGESSRLRTVFDRRGGRLDMYISLPELAAELARGKPWIKFDMLRELRRQGLARGDLFTTALQTPGTYLDALRAAHQDVDELGTDRIDGVRTRHYRVRLTVDDVVEAAPPPKRRALRRFLGTDVGAVESDIWVGDEGLIRRIAERFEDGARGEYTMTFHDWGAPFTLRLPPPRRTVDGNELFAKSGP
jgi:hypothetical protein